MDPTKIKRMFGTVDGLDPSNSEPAPSSGLPFHVVHTDVGNGARFADLHRESIRYIADTGVWVHYDGRRWASAHSSHLARLAKGVIDRMASEAVMVAAEDKRIAALKWVTQSAMSSKIDSMIKMAASEKSLEIEAADLDRHPHLLTVANGIVDLRTGELRPHDKTLMLTKLVNIEYSPSATACRWQKFLREVFNEKDDLIAWMQRAIGYSLTAATREQKFFLCYGAGANGKGRLLEVLEQLLGDAAVNTSFGTLTADRSTQGGATPELAALCGARVVIAGEPDAGVRLSEGLIKLLTGDDQITARRLYQAPFTFAPTFKIWLHADHKPEIRGTDDGIWRRPKLIPFDVSFKGREDRELDAKLAAEMPGILAWAVQGARDWYENGLGDCEAVTAATEAYRQESDIIGQFVADILEPSSPEEFISTKDMVAKYEAWCLRNGQKPVKPNTLAKKLVARDGIRSGKLAHVRGYYGARLRGDT